jgi:arylsulfatase A
MNPLSTTVKKRLSILNDVLSQTQSVFERWAERAPGPFWAATCRPGTRPAGSRPQQASGLFYPEGIGQTGSQRNCVRLACFLLLALGQILSAAEAHKPNIVLMMADDFGYECVTANGGQSYQTPHLDRLAATGVRFEQCHVQPLCTPTRVELMTGRSNVRNYVRFGTLLTNETTFAHLLKRAGYATGICGKWQLGHGKDLLRHFGFDESCLWQHTRPRRAASRYANPGLDYDGVPKDFDQGEYGPKLVNDFALDFVTRHRAHPFFLYYPMMLTHDPFQPTPDSPDWDPKAIGEEVNRHVRYFADMTAYMDQMVGRLVAKLQELGIRNHTLVLFLGDNGTTPSITSRFQGVDYRGGKGRTTNRGTHVPLIANWPAVIQSGRVNRDLISSVDFLPTLCEAAGVPIPANIDGVSFLPQLRGERGRPRRWLYSWYSPRQQADLTVREFAFDHRFKLYRTGEFYDLDHDIDEVHPLKVAALEGDAAAAAKRLQGALDQFDGARPAELDRAFVAAAKASGTQAPAKEK